MRGICRFWHLPSNGVIAKIVLCDADLLCDADILCDADLLCEGQKLKKNYISETLRASAKNVWEVFIEFNICHRILSMQKLYCDFDQLFEGQNKQKLYLTRKELAQKCVGDICIFHIYLRMVYCENNTMWPWPTFCRWIFYIFEKVGASARMCGRHLQILAFAIEWCDCEYCTMWPWLHFEGQQFYLYIS